MPNSYSMENTTQVNVTALIEKALVSAKTYVQYIALMEDLAASGKSTGEIQTEDLTNYTMLNHKRMKRLGKTIKINEEIATRIKQLDRKMTWLVLTESWCGDAAQTMPIMNKMASLNADIDLKIILRDENLELMNQFLYNNTLSIPKLIVIDREINKVVGDWGPRPSSLTKIVEDFKAENGTLTPEFKQELQVWYNKDKGKNTVTDLIYLP